MDRNTHLYKILLVLAYSIGWYVRGARSAYRWVEWKLVDQYFYRNPKFAFMLAGTVFHEFQKHVPTCGVQPVGMKGPGYDRNEKVRTLAWDAPYCMTVFADGKPLFGMAVEVKFGILYIRQLQGVAGAEIPKELRNWPQIFVRATKRFARLSGLKGVRIYRAHINQYFWNPVDTAATRDEYWANLKPHQERMRRRYDGTARQMGFAMKKDYGEWLCPPRAPGPS